MGPTKTIFIIEDSAILPGIISVSIKQEFDCDTLLFKNADLAMDHMSECVPDLIILDYKYNEKELKFQTGLDFLMAFRKKYKTPVIVFSGQRDKGVALEIIRQGANDYINKDDDDFMDGLLLSIGDILKIQKAKSGITQFKSSLKKVIIGFFVLIILCVIFIGCLLC